MKTQMIKWMLGAAAAASVSMSASAANLFLDFNGVGPAVAVTYSLNGNSANTSAGVFNWTVLAGSTQPGFSVGQQVKTFCIELTQNVSDPTNFNVQSLASTPNTGAMGAVRAAMLGDLFARFYNTAVTGTAIQAAAFQIAVWEIVWEDTANATDVNTLKAGLDATAGDFLITNNSGNADSARDLANTWFASLLTGGLKSFGLAGLTNPNAQDQVIVVPVPAPAALAGLGLIGIVALRRRMKA